MTSISNGRFKQTDAGQIPEDWDVSSIGEALQFYSGKAHEPFVSRFGKYVVVNSKFISTDGQVRKHCTVNLLPGRTGDILMVMSDLPNGRALAKCFLVDRDNLYAVNQRVCIFRSRVHDPRYLQYALNRNPYFIAFDDGVQQTHLLNDPIKKCPLVLPARAEQGAIADALTDADSLITTLEHLIAKKQAIKQGLLQELLTRRTRLPGFRRPSKSCRLGDVLTVRHGKSQKSVEASGGKYPILATGGEIGRTNTALYSKPSVLIGRKGTIDRPQYQDAPFWTVDTLFFTEISSDADPKFLYYLFTTIDWRSMNEASGVPSLSASRVEGVQVELPPLDEQRAIRRVLDDSDAEIELLRTRRSKAQGVKLGMMQELLTGRTRLRVAEVVS